MTHEHSVKKLYARFNTEHFLKQNNALFLACSSLLHAKKIIL